MHSVGPLHPQTPNLGSKTTQVFIEKKFCVSRPTQFKPMFFEGEL